MEKCAHFQAQSICMKKTHSQETKQSSEPNSDMTEMLELRGREFKITLTNVYDYNENGRQHAKLSS